MIDFLVKGILQFCLLLQTAIIAMIEQIKTYIFVLFMNVRFLFHLFTFILFILTSILTMSTLVKKDLYQEK